MTNSERNMSGYHARPAEAARELENIYQEQLLNAGEAKADSPAVCSREVCRRAWRRKLFNLVKYAKLICKREGVPEQHPRHSIAAVRRLQDILNTVAEALNDSGFCRTGLTRTVRMRVFFVRGYINHPIALLDVHREVQAADMPFG